MPASDLTRPASDDADAVEEFLDTPLSRRPLPSRMLSWADRRQVPRFRDLLAWSPRQLLREGNLGRQSIHRTRVIIERETGLTWEALNQRIRGEGASDDATEPPPSMPGWDRLVDLVGDQSAALPLASIDLPTRMRGFIARAGLRTLGELLRWSREELLRQPNVGAGTIADSATAIYAHVRARSATSRSLSRPEPQLDDYGDFAALLRQKLAALNPVDRLVLTQRAGLTGEPQRQVDIAEVLGVSRQRVDQIEDRALSVLARDGWWINAIEARLRGRMEGGVVPLAALADDPFWAGVEDQRHVLDYLLHAVLERRLQVVALDGGEVIAEVSQRAVDEAWENLLAATSDLEFPVDAPVVDALADRLLGGLGPALAGALRERLEQRLHRIEGPGATRYAGIGQRRADQVLAYLNTSPGPVTIAELLARLGTKSLPEEAIHVDHGVVALPRHVPDFERWSRRLAPVCAGIMRREGPHRQWSTVELLDLVLQEAQLPAWLNAWHLAAMLRSSSEIISLGRLRVALRETHAGEERVHARDLIARVLDAAGAPLSQPEIRERVRVHGAVSELVLSYLLLRPPFIELGPDRFGLIARDLPGGMEAWMAAAEALEEELEVRGAGMSLVEATTIVGEASGDPATWTPEAVGSVARGAPALRVGRGDRLGLASWEGTRVPTRGAILRACLTEDGGVTRVTKVQERIAAVRGVWPERRHLTGLVFAAGASIRGDVIVDRDVEEEARSSRPRPAHAEPLPDPRAMPGFPVHAMHVFEDLLEEPEGDLDALRAAITAHACAYEAAAAADPLLDAGEGDALAARALRLLDAFGPAATPAERRVAWAAARYFVKQDDAESDFQVGGLDDDREVLDAVERWLGRP